MSARWLVPAVLLVLAATAMLLLAPLGPVLREARESSALLERLLAERRLEDALAVLAAGVTANAWPWPLAGAEEPRTWQVCDRRWPCGQASATSWVLRPEAAGESGIERAALLLCPAAGCFAPYAELELRARSEIGEAGLELLGWKPPELSGFGSAWLQPSDEVAGLESGGLAPGCDLSALVLAHRPPRSDCSGPPPPGDEDWLSRFAERLAPEGLCERRAEPQPALLWIPAGAIPSCAAPLRFGTRQAPVLVVIDLPAQVGSGGALEIAGAVLLRPSADRDAVLRVEGRLAVRGLLAAEGKIDLAGELAIEPDPELLARLGARTVWRPRRGGGPAERSRGD
jgi:hypothetical protein